MECKLAGESGLTGTVQTGHEHDAGLSLDIYRDVLGAHEIGKFVVDDLDHHLLRLDCCQYILAESFGLYAIAEFLGDLVADVGVKKRLTDILDGLGDIDFGDFPFSLKYLE